MSSRKHKTTPAASEDAFEDVVEQAETAAADVDSGAERSNSASEGEPGTDSPPNAAPEAGESATETDPAVPLQQQFDELQQRFLRVSADYQNFVRRSQQNIGTARDQQLMDIAKALVVVIDHFDLAMEVDPETTSTQSVLEGVAIVRDELLKALEGFGIQRLNVQPGEPFDPNCHEALMRQPSDDMETDRVVTQIQPGYILGEKTIRPAKVTVAE